MVCVVKLCAKILPVYSPLDVHDCNITGFPALALSSLAMSMARVRGF